MRKFCLSVVFLAGCGLSDVPVEDADTGSEAEQGGWHFGSGGQGATGDTDESDADTDADTDADSDADTDDCGNAEIYYNGIDDDCDDQTDDLDQDGDGFILSEDCDDTDADINPDENEECDGAGHDEDCDGLVNDDDPDVPREFTVYHDADGDGYGDPDNSQDVCESPDESWIGDSSDCDDTDDDVSPEADEVYYDGVDNDCSSSTNDADMDGDGVPLASDCDDTDDDISEDCDDTDSDPDPGSDPDDDDGDGYSEAEGDCDDTDDNVNPAADDDDNDGLDNDCDGIMTDVVCVFVDSDDEDIEVTMYNRTESSGSWSDPWASGDSPVCATVRDIEIGEVWQFNGNDADGYLVTEDDNRITSVWIGDYVLTVGARSTYDCVWTNDGYGTDDWCTIAFYQ